MKTAKDVIDNFFFHTNTISKDALASDAFSIMETENRDYMVVLEDNECVGIVSEIDYMKKIILAGINSGQTKVQDIMTSSICFVDMKDPVLKCLELMDSFKIRHLLVFENASFRGVITLHDVMRAIFEETVIKQFEQEQIKNF